MTNAAWLNWIGKPYKNTVEFLSEARSSGIILEVSLEFLQRMSWKDDVYCIMEWQGDGGPSVFCRFPISRLYGITREIADLLREHLQCEETAAGGDFVHRLGVRYMEGGTWSVNADLQEVHAVLDRGKKSGLELDTLMVGCYADEFLVMAIPWPVLTGLSAFKGFRDSPFCAREFLKDVHLIKAAAKTYEIRLPSQYAAVETLSHTKPGHFQWVAYYEFLKTRPRQTEFHFQ